MALTINEKDGIAILSFQEGTEGDVSWELRDGIRELLKGKQFKIIVDMTYLEMVSSSVLSVILYAWEKTRAHQGDIILCNVSEMTKELLQVTNLDGHFVICDTVENALAHLEVQ